MANLAANLVDLVLPPVPLRQWVLSLPVKLRYLIAHRPDLITAVLRELTEVVGRWLRERTGQPDGKPGIVTLIQRFGGALNLNIHFHLLVLDGVYTWPEGAAGPGFRPAPGPTPDEVLALTADLAERITRRLESLGVLAGDEAAEPESPGPLDQCAAASVQGLVLGPGGARPATRQGVIDPRLIDQRGGEIRGVRGFSLHVGHPISPHDREAAEKLCRYVARPAVSNERLAWRDDGKLVWTLRRAWSDGTTHLVFEPLQLLQRLAALVPPPRANLVRYHGVLAPASPWRPAIAPGGDPARARRAGYPDGPGYGPSPPRRVRPRTPNRYLPWATLMRRVFAFDVLRCPDCAGRMELISLIEERDVIAQVLGHLELSTQPPERYPAREQLTLYS